MGYELISGVIEGPPRGGVWDVFSGWFGSPSARRTSLDSQNAPGSTYDNERLQSRGV